MGAGRTLIEAVVFDMDGVLIDSEPLWRRAEIECFGEVGVPLTEQDCRQTMGLRMDEVVRLWFERRPWPHPDPAALVDRIVDRAEALVIEEGVAMVGALEAVSLCRELGLGMAVASSSSHRVISATLARLGIEDAFDVVHSADDEPLGKPHPGVFLTAAERLGVAPTSCVVIEDSVNGMVAAVAARMRCVMVPEHPDPRFDLADVVLDSLVELTVADLTG
jgi:mannitol-1-/sugar-/sorbitol-6-/2-deoxyglucose-6-phosphatase